MAMMRPSTMTKRDLVRYCAELDAKAEERYSEEELDRRYRLSGDGIRRALGALKERGAPFTLDDLAYIAGTDRRAFDYWIADHGRKSCPFGKQVARLAEALEVGLSSITLPGLLEEEMVDEDLPTQVPARARVGALREYWSILNWYRQHLGWRWNLPGFCLREFAHSGSSPDYYAEVVIKPELFPLLDPVEFIFAFRSPGMRNAKLLPVRRVDYGRIVLFPDRRVHLASTFQNQTASGHATREGSFRVWTWFGKEPCEFQVRSMTAFELEARLEDKARHPGDDPNAVAFLAAPHHLQTSGVDARRRR